MCYGKLFIVIRITERKWVCHPFFLSVIHTVIIGTVLNFNGENNGHGLKTLHVKLPFGVNFLNGM